MSYLNTGIEILVYNNKLYVSFFLEKMLKSLMKGITDRNATIRKSYASTIAVITTVAKETTVNKLLQSLTNVYIENEGKPCNYLLFMKISLNK